MKKILFIIGVVFIVGIFGYALIDRQDPHVEGNLEQQVLTQTLALSKEYTALRYLTDNLLLNTHRYDYDSWNTEMTNLITLWELFETETFFLEEQATHMSEEKIGFTFSTPAFAYSNEEISNVFDKAPAGKKIATLAKYLGVDAKKAYQILKQDQAQVEADAWNEEGDAMKKYEATAVVVKDICKVSTFIGTIALTGGTAAIASGSTLGQIAVVVSGADLALEITDDGAKIALGDKNKISAVIGDARVITEPASAILMISTLPQNLTKGIDKLNAISFGADQLNTTVQDGKVIGIKLPVYTTNAKQEPTEVAVLEKNEIESWLEDQGKKVTSETVTEIENVMLEAKNSTLPEPEAYTEKTPINEEQKEIQEVQNIGSVVGVWKGMLTYTPNKSEPEQQMEYVVTLQSDGTVDPTGNGEPFSVWKQEGDSIKLFMKDDATAYFEFSLSGDTLTFIKLAGPNSEGEWQEDYAGEDFFGGTFYEITLKKQ